MLEWWAWNWASDARMNRSLLMPDFWEEFGGDLSPEANGELEREVEVTLPIKYWMSTLAAINLSCKDVAQRLREMREAGKTERDLSDKQRMALAGPIYVRAAIVEILADEGILKPEVRDR